MTDCCRGTERICMQGSREPSKSCSATGWKTKPLSLLTITVVALVAVAFWNNPYHWFFAFLIVGVVWSIGGGILGWMALHEFQSKGLFPKKTIEVLKADKMWIQSEAGDRV